MEFCYLLTLAPHGRQGVTVGPTATWDQQNPGRPIFQSLHHFLGDIKRMSIHLNMKWYSACMLLLLLKRIQFTRLTLSSSPMLQKLSIITPTACHVSFIHAVTRFGYPHRWPHGYCMPSSIYHCIHMDVLLNEENSYRNTVIA